MQRPPFNSQRSEFDPPNFRPLELPENENASNFLSDYAIYSAIKKVASFRSRKNVTGVTVEELSKNLWTKLQESREEVPEYVLTVLTEINGAMPSYGRLDTKLYENLYIYFSIYIYDKENGNPRHQCNKPECFLHCVQPIFARKVFPESEASRLFCVLKRIFTENPSLLSTTRRENEAENAKNLLKYVAALGDQSLKDSYDVLYAMAGHHETIFDPNRWVDFSLYDQLFDLFRSFDYRRVSPRGRKICAITLLDTQSSQSLADSVSRIGRFSYVMHRPRTLPAALGGSSSTNDASITLYSRNSTRTSTSTRIHTSVPPAIARTTNSQSNTTTTTTRGTGTISSTGSAAFSRTGTSSIGRTSLPSINTGGTSTARRNDPSITLYSRNTTRTSTLPRADSSRTCIESSDITLREDTEYLPHRDAPPSYHSLSFDTTVIPSAPDDNNYPSAPPQEELPTYYQVLTEIMDSSETRI